MSTLRNFVIGLIVVVINENRITFLNLKISFVV